MFGFVMDSVLWFVKGKHSSRTPAESSFKQDDGQLVLTKKIRSDWQGSDTPRSTLYSGISNISSVKSEDIHRFV